LRKMDLEYNSVIDIIRGRVPFGKTVLVRNASCRGELVNLRFG